MPNIGALLKQEIARLSRREVRALMQSMKKASAQYRHHIAELKRQTAALERQVALLQRRAPGKLPTAPTGETGVKMRFVAKGMKSHRNRLGLSAADYGRLVGVSAQSVYNWEQGQATPRAEQLKMIAALRGVGKRDAQRRLDELATKAAPKPRKR